MAEKEITEALFILRKEVEKIEGDHPELKDKMESLLTKLEHRLEAEEDDHQLHLVDDMKTALTQFEVEHPTASGIINELMLTLSNIGV
jgi:seryl-tRNA synthetase